MRRRRKLPIFGKYPSNGEYYVYCDRSGRKMRKKDTMTTWDNFIVQPKDWEPRQPLDMPPKVRPERVIRNTRPEPTNNFFSLTCYIDNGQVICTTVPRDLPLATQAQIDAAVPTVTNASVSFSNQTNIGSTLTTVSASDPQGLDLTYSITAGNTNERFFIGETDGVIKLNDNSNLAADDQFVLTVKVVNTINLEATGTITLTVIEGYNGLVLSYNPAIYLLLDETSGTSAADSSTNSVGGTYRNSSDVGVSVLLDNEKLATGLSGRSPVFLTSNLLQPNNSDIVNVYVDTSLSRFNATTALTVMCWIKPATYVNFPNTSTGTVVSMWRSGPGYKYRFGTEQQGPDSNNDTRLVIELGEPSDNGATIAYKGISAANLTDVQSAHSIAFVFNNGTLSVYYDGLANTFTTVSGAVPSTLAEVSTTDATGTPFMLGNVFDKGDQFEGNIQAAFHTNQALSSAQISELHNLAIAT